MILPPPNITGDLHLGHSMTVAIQDAIIRYKKMTGYETAWIPGYDHAGIATHLIIDKLLKKSKNVNSKNLSKEEYMKITEEWKKTRISKIRSQMEMMGALLDHTREYFTLDDKMSEAVKEAFVRLFDDGFIYRNKTLVNWSFFLKSTLSDIEIDWLRINGPTKVSVPGFDEPVTFGELFTFSYPLYNDLSGRTITVATTRPETIMADVAVAVNPDDTRYQSLIGRNLFHPLTGSKMPIIADSRIDVEFGSGAMKVTPGHSSTDYEIGKDHQLPLMNVFDENGCIQCSRLRPEASHLNGLNRFDAKEKVVQVLKEKGMFVRVESHETRVPVCARSKDVIESCLKDQWFVKTSLLVECVEDGIKSGQIKMTPESAKRGWLNWCNEADWCISRQIRWGHQIPAYRIMIDGKETQDWVAAKSKQEAVSKAFKRVAAKSKEEVVSKAFKKTSISSSRITLNQDEDVLDTWFSSSLLPFSALGWPQKSVDDEYPLALMETGHDILGFWVHRMALLSYKLTGKFGFKEVLLHGMICDSSGKKMTKSLGNVIDPIDVVKGASLEDLLQLSKNYHDKGLLTSCELKRAYEGQRKLFPTGIPKCGSDALRLSLYQNDFLRQNIKLDIVNITHNRSFVNKMWQTIRYLNGAVIQLEECLKLKGTKEGNYDIKWIKCTNELQGLKLSPIDVWILSRLSSFVTVCNKSFNSYEFHNIYTAAHKFWIQSLCDVYLETLKGFIGNIQEGKDRMNHDEMVTSFKLFAFCLDTSLRLLHPLIPFISEELFQRLLHLTDQEVTERSILDHAYPNNLDFIDWANSQIENEVSLILHLVSKLRSVTKDLTDHKRKQQEGLKTEDLKQSEKEVSGLKVLVISPSSLPLSSYHQVILNLVKKNSIQELKFIVKGKEREEDIEGKEDEDFFPLYQDREQEVEVRIKPRIELIEFSIDRLSLKVEKLRKQLGQLSSQPSSRRLALKVKIVNFDFLSVTFLFLLLIPTQNINALLPIFLPSPLSLFKDFYFYLSIVTFFSLFLRKTVSRMK